MRGVLPPAAAPYAFGFLLSGFMSLLVSGIATFMEAGLGPLFAASWMRAWLSSWPVAFPIVLVVAPMVRRIVGYLVAVPAKASS